MRSTLLLVFAAAAAIATPAAATPQEHPAPECGAAPAALPPELAGWTGRTPAVSAVDEAGLDGAAIGIGRGVDAALHKTAALHYVLRPEKPGGSVSYGGLFAFTAAEPGTYRVALGAPAWIDVLSEGKAVTSSAPRARPRLLGHRQDGRLSPERRAARAPARGERPAVHRGAGRQAALTMRACRAGVLAAALLCLLAAPGARAADMAARAELGRRLFYDADLSIDGTMSCATCHEQKRGFTDDNPTRPGVHGAPGRRNVMALANVAWAPVLTWGDPRLDTLEKQAAVPIAGTDPVEMGMAGHEAAIAERLGADGCYRAMFARAFPAEGGRDHPGHGDPGAGGVPADPDLVRQPL